MREGSAPVGSHGDEIPKESDVERQEREAVSRVHSIKAQLETFAQEWNIRSLADRTQRGLNELSLFGVKETADMVRSITEKTGASYEDVVKIALDLQVGGPWQYAKRLHDAADPEAKTTLLLLDAASRATGREMDLTPREFVSDIERIEGKLQAAVTDPDTALEMSRQRLSEEGKGKAYRLEDGVPVTESDSGFLFMALDGHESGVWQDADGIVFVGAKEIDSSRFEAWGLKKVLKDDRGRKNVPFYVNSKGDELFKLVHSGFVVVTSRNLELGKAIVRHAARKEDGLPSKEVFEPILYPPTSKPEEEEGHIDKMGFLRRREHDVTAPLSESREILRLKDEFYDRMGWVKEHVIFLDSLEATRKSRLEKGKDFTERDFDALVEKTERKVRQKMEELRYIIEKLRKPLSRLSHAPETIIDMAGGAGDLGLAVANEYLTGSLPLKEVRIVDPFSKAAALDIFTGQIIDHIPFSDELRQKVRHTNEPLQKAEITPDSAVVAKHACGTLSDDVIEKWVNSESPLLAIMTCCQDKAAEQPARYGFSQNEWRRLCVDSGKTNAMTPEQLSGWLDAISHGAAQSREDVEAKFIAAFNTEQIPPSLIHDVTEALKKSQGSVEQTLADVDAPDESGWKSDMLAVELAPITKDYSKTVEGKGWEKKDMADKTKFQKRFAEKVEKILNRHWFIAVMNREFGKDIAVNDDQAAFLRGMQAMTALDKKRVEYLNRRGFSSEFHQTSAFPKGDVIIARRKKGVSST